MYRFLMIVEDTPVISYRGKVEEEESFSDQHASSLPPLSWSKSRLCYSACVRTQSVHAHDRCRITITNTFLFGGAAPTSFLCPLTRSALVGPFSLAASSSLSKNWNSPSSSVCVHAALPFLIPRKIVYNMRKKVERKLEESLKELCIRICSYI